MSAYHLSESSDTTAAMFTVTNVVIGGNTDADGNPRP